jgi:ferredoxin
MNQQTPTYLDRRGLRAMERAWTGLEGFINRLASAAATLRPYNPLYHLGALEIFLLLLLGATGIILLLLYRPGADRAFESVQAISSGWLGSLIRTAHRYASDVLIVVAFLHALKMLLSNRFWGSRWLAWVSGWLLVVLFWLTGTMGYFLVWDGAAQWLTEYAVNSFGGAFALSFFGPQAAGRTYSFFVIVLFLHAFLPLILAIGVLIHVLRLQRPRVWAPRWLMVAATALLILASVLWPALSDLPADLRRLVVGSQIDWLYLGFLPLISRLGNPAFWGLSLAALALVTALPWLRRGQHPGPSAVDAARCTGCAACARECPYNAIEMCAQPDGAPHTQLAIIKERLCTGCGVCVAACSEDAIDLKRLSFGGLRRQVANALASARQADDAPLLVYACDRHAALGSLPDPVRLMPQPALSEEDGKRRVRLGAWPGMTRPVVTCALPCIGALQADAVSEALAAGAADVLVVACPANDCGYREGGHWLAARRERRPVLRQPNVRVLAAAPGSRAAVLAAPHAQQSPSGLQGTPRQVGESGAPNLFGGSSERKSSFGLEPSGDQPGAHAQSAKASRPAQLARSLAVSLAVLAAFVIAAVAVNRPAQMALPQQAQIRVIINHHGQLIARSQNLPPNVRAKLPQGVDPALVLGGERFPVRLRVAIDGQPAIERLYQPAGLRREGSVYGLEAWWLAPGAHPLEISLMDDNATWRTAFTGTVNLAAGQSAVLIYDPDSKMFARWQ